MIHHLESKRDGNAIVDIFQIEMRASYLDNSSKQCNGMKKASDIGVW